MGSESLSLPIPSSLAATPRPSTSTMTARVTRIMPPMYRSSPHWRVRVPMLGVSIRVSVSGSCRVEVGVFD